MGIENSNLGNKTGKVNFNQGVLYYRVNFELLLNTDSGSFSSGLIQQKKQVNYIIESSEFTDISSVLFKDTLPLLFPSTPWPWSTIACSATVS